MINMRSFRQGAAPVASTDLVHLDPALKKYTRNWLIYLPRWAPAAVMAPQSGTTTGEEGKMEKQRQDNESGRLKKGKQESLENH